MTHEERWRPRRRAMSQQTRVCVIGLWHLGSVTAACLAHLGLWVAAIEPDAQRRERLAQGIPPVHEPGLATLLQQGIASGRLTFPGDAGSAVADAECVLFAEDVPVDERDEPDVSRLLETVRAVAPYLREDATVVIQSQVPVGTCARVLDVVRGGRGGGVALVYCPENLRLGDAVDRFLHPDAIVIGADTPRARACADDLFRSIHAPRLVMTVRSAEMAKHALNFLLATAISFGNEVGRMCELAGADAWHVIDALRRDRRIGDGLPISPGPAFSGGTLARDLAVLRRLAGAHGATVPLLEGVLAANQVQRDFPLTRLERVFSGLRGLRVAVLGLTYKAGTSTVRRSLALEFIATLEARGATVAAYDPLADPSELESGPAFVRAADPYAAARGADAVVIMTNWPEFRTLDLRRLREGMRREVLIDMWNMLDGTGAAAAGFAYHGITGRVKS